MSQIEISTEIQKKIYFRDKKLAFHYVKYFPFTKMIQSRFYYFRLIGIFEFEQNICVKSKWTFRMERFSNWAHLHKKKSLFVDSCQQCYWAA